MSDPVHHPAHYGADRFTEDAGGEMSEFTIDHGHNITLMVRSS